MVPAQQLPVYPGELVEGGQEFLIRLDAVARLQDLGFSLKQESPHPAFGQAAAQVEERTMFIALAAMAIGAATGEEAFEEGGMDNIWGKLEGVEQTGLALAQGQGGKALEF